MNTNNDVYGEILDALDRLYDASDCINDTYLLSNEILVKVTIQEDKCVIQDTISRLKVLIDSARSDNEKHRLALSVTDDLRLMAAKR